MKTDPNEKLRYSLLLEFYGALLSTRQYELLDFYCNDDLSLSEISENTGITRQGVRDGLNKACAILTDTEEKLHMYRSWCERAKQADALCARLEQLGVADSQINEAVEKLRN